MPLSGDRILRCNASGNCLESVTHSWRPQETTFYVCAIHATAYNATGRTDYRPIAAYNAEHGEVGVIGRCQECGDTVPFNENACSRFNGTVRIGVQGAQADGRCVLCLSCFRSTSHRHCLGCGQVAADSWTCEDCGRSTCCREISSYNENRCDRCWEDEDSDSEYPRGGYIHEYHHYDLPKARPVMQNSMHKGRPYLWLGVELECEMEDRHERSNAAEAIAGEFGEASGDPFVVLAEDGSLNSGFETITGPMSLQHHKELWPKLAPFMAKQGLRSWKHSTTGMHVHVSRNFFSQLEIGKMLVFLNSRKTYDNITKLAGRKENHYAQIKPKKLSAAYNGENDDRYNALNTTNSKTLEFRIFKGTLKTGHILANLEFVHALCMYVKNASVRVMEDWPMFWQYVLKNRREYSNLIAFFDQSMEEIAA